MDGTGKRRREPLVGGIALILIGALLLLAQLVPDISSYIPLAIGLGLLALFVLKRDYGLLIGGAVVTGVGVGIVIAATVPDDLGGAGFLLSLGGGFLGIWVVSYALRMKERHWWPLVPGLILSAIGGALAIGGPAVDLIDYWPVVLIVIGILLLGRWLLAARSDG